MDTTGFVCNENGYWRKNGATYSLGIRMTLVTKWAALKDTIDEDDRDEVKGLVGELAEALGPTARWCLALIDKWEAGDSIMPAEKGGCTHFKFGAAELDFLVLLLKANPSRQLSDYKEMFHSTIGVHVSTTQIGYYLNHELLETLKKATIDRMEKFYPENMTKFMEFLALIAIVPAHLLYFFDEMMGTPRNGGETPRQRSSRGTPATNVRPNPQYYRVSVNGLTSIKHNSPSIYLNVCDQTTTAADFIDFFFGVHGAVTAGFLGAGKYTVRYIAAHLFTIVHYSIMHSPRKLRILLSHYCAILIHSCRQRCVH